jgi:hypothetical protein
MGERSLDSGDMAEISTLIPEERNLGYFSYIKSLFGRL